MLVGDLVDWGVGIIENYFTHRDHNILRAQLCVFDRSLHLIAGDKSNRLKGYEVIKEVVGDLYSTDGRILSILVTLRGRIVHIDGLNKKHLQNIDMLNLTKLADNAVCRCISEVIHELQPIYESGKSIYYVGNMYVEEKSGHVTMVINGLVVDIVKGEISHEHY